MAINTRDLLLDPYIISIRDDLTQKDSLELIERIILWSSVSDVTGCRLVVSVKYFGSLWTDQQYPTYEKIKTLINTCNTKVYDAPTIQRAINYITDICPKIEDILYISDLLLDKNRNDLTPRELMNRLGPNVAESFCQTLATCSLYYLLSGEEYLIGLASVYPSTGEKRHINANFRILTYESDIETNLPSPLDCTINCALLLSFDDVYRNLEFCAVCHDIERAIKWSCIHNISDEARRRQPLKSFVVRAEFRDRISLVDEAVLLAAFRKLVFLLSGLHTGGLEIEPLRTSKGGNSPQRIRSVDNAKAFRMQISQHGAGYHIHYWDVPDGSLEIAWFGTHDDFHIPE